MASVTADAIRSAHRRMAELMAAGKVGEREGVVVASAGNFGQGVAYAGRAMGIPIIVVAATTANPAKVAAMRRLGADVRMVGEDFDAARLPDGLSDDGEDLCAVPQDGAG
jgi:threonine dehydratase